MNRRLEASSVTCCLFVSVEMCLQFRQQEARGEELHLRCALKFNTFDFNRQFRQMDCMNVAK